jgi:prepilin-type N-terminal cleavage/methylation domain-containing protein
MKILEKIKTTKHNQHGFTLIELLIGLVITAIIGTVVMVSLSQIMGVGESNKNRVTAINQVENALQYVNKDVQVANTITLDPSSGSGFPVSLIWKTWDNKTCKVVYTTENGNMIRRYYENDMNLPVAVNLVAYSIDISSPGQTNCNYVNNLFTLKLTSTVGAYKPISVTRTIKITPRSVHFYN